MVFNPHRIEFRHFEDMATHLDHWATRALASPDGWHDALLASRAWLDYSARNQVLLASYEIDGPVAGAETWRLVPSTDGRNCAVRAGEHGLPVRVPVTTGGAEPDPYLGGTRPTRAAVERWEWRPVFGIPQLARRPGPDALTPIEIPEALRGGDRDEAYLDAVRKVATSTVRGRLPKSTDPHRILADAAARLTRTGKRPPLEPVLRDQVAWLVADRVGLAREDLPVFDAEPLGPRERWQRLQAVLDPARRLTAALGVGIGVDLTASPLPRMEIIDDRVVPAGRRHRLPAASLNQLPIGRWVDVGPYTAAEWAARGEHASGRGAYLRLNKTAYLVAIETGDGAAWRLEDIATRTGHGLLASGTARDLPAAREAAVATVGPRYPVLTSDVVRPSTTGDGAAWEAMPGRGRSAAQMRHLDDHITLYAIPGPGGRWMPAIQIGPRGTLDRLPLVKTLDEARTAAELEGRRAARLAALDAPVRFDQIVAELARSSDYHRNELVDLVGHRLQPDDRARLAAQPEPGELIELLGAAGVTPATTVLVLHAENLHADQVAPLLPTIGVPIPDAIRVLTEHWELAAVDAAGMLGATAHEMRQAGCTPVEIMAARPRDILRALPEDPHLWELAAGTMATAGHPVARVVGQLVNHAPTPDAFAAGLTTAAGDASDGIAFAVRHGAQPEQLAAATERYGLSPADAGMLLRDAGASAHIAVETIHLRCDHDPALACDIAQDVLGLDRDDVLAILDGEPRADDVVAAARIADLGDPASLFAALPPPGPSTEVNPESLLDLLPAPAIDTPDLATVEQ